MSNVENLLKERNIPDALKLKSGRSVKAVADFEKRRTELKKILENEIYGKIPEAPDHLTVNVISEDAVFCAGKAPLRKYEAVCSFGDEKIAIPFYSVIPKSDKPLPAFVHINFRDNVPDKYMLSEEIADRGFAVFSFCYNDVSVDNPDMKLMRDKLGKYLLPKRRAKNSPGKIAMWAWFAMRIMDYIENLDTIDHDNVAVVGHSRLGKTALLTGAFDERFKYVISNCSGCAGAAITRGKIGEQVPRIASFFPHWFCQNYLDNADNFESRNYDQNFLMALSVPRHILVGSAEEDLWADPTSEFLCLAETNRVYALYGKNGLVHNDEIPAPGSVLSDGDASYHHRHGKHYFSREDWHVYMDYIEKNMKK